MDVSRLETLRSRTAALIDQLHGVLMQIQNEQARDALAGSIGSTLALVTTRYTALIAELQSLNAQTYLMHPLALPPQDPDFGNGHDPVELTTNDYSP